MNTVADTLSRYLVNFKDHNEEHVEAMSPELVSAVWQGCKAVQECDVPWVAALQFEGGDAKVLSPDSISRITSENIGVAQQEDPANKEVISLKLNQ